VRDLHPFTESVKRQPDEKLPKSLAFADAGIAKPIISGYCYYLSRGPMAARPQVQAHGPHERPAIFGGGVGSCAAKRFAKDGTRTSEVTVTCCDTTNSVCDDTPEVLDVAGHKPVDHT